jgi:gliding motility-associated-like protein
MCYPKNKAGFARFFTLTICFLFSVFARNELYAQCPTFSFPNPTCAGDNCGAGTPFSVLGDTTGITSYLWDFGTGQPGDTSNLYNPVFAYQNPGSFTVSLTTTRQGQPPVTCKLPITVNGFGAFTIGTDLNLGPQDEEICKGTTKVLKAEFAQGQQAPSNPKYLWSTGATTETITVPDTVGCYSLTITDDKNCSRSNKVNITVYKPDPNTPPPPKEESRWYFGNGAGIKFEGGQPTPISNNNIKAPEGVSIISGSTGALLFYTDGQTVWDKQNGVMVNGTGLNGGNASTQAVLVVAQPGCNDCEPVYYVFTTSNIEDGADLYYSVVDMRKNGGLGEVTFKNILLSNLSTERVTSVVGTPDTSNGNSNPTQTTWILTHDFQTNAFTVYPFTAKGLESPKKYNVGTAHTSNANGEGYLKAYSDKVVIVIPGENGQENLVEVFDFDATTGEVKPNPITLMLDTAQPPPPLPKAYGAELVGDRLYVSMAGSGTGTDYSKLIQFNMAFSTADSVQKSLVVIDSTANQVYGALQVDPYGQRVYLAVKDASALGVINNPQGLGRDQVGFDRDGFALTGGTSQLGLPNTTPPQNQGYAPGFTAPGPFCANGPVQVTDFVAQSGRAQYNDGTTVSSTYEWTFYNAAGTVLGTTTSTDLSQANSPVSFTFPGPGIYPVSVKITTDCKLPWEPEEVKDTVIINQLPPPVNVPDQTVCQGQTVTLDAYPGLPGPANAVYTWTLPDGSTKTGKSITTTLSGVHSVTVGIADCSQSDPAITVTFVDPKVNLGNDTTLCEGGSLLLNAGNPGSTYEWRNETTGQVIGAGQTLQVTPTTNTTYSVKVTTPTGCTISDQIVVNVGSKPVIAVTERIDVTDCSGANSGNGKITITVGPETDDKYEATWIINGTPNLLISKTTRSVPNLAPGVYRIWVKSITSGCQSEITVTIGVINNPLKYTPDPPVVANCATNKGTINLTKDAASPVATKFDWRDTNGAPVGTDQPFLEAEPGQYTVTITDASVPPCPVFLTVEILRSDQPQLSDPTATVTGCGTATLFANVTGTAPASPLQWSGPTGAAVPLNPDGTATATTSGTYTVTAVSTVPACTVSKTVNVTLPTPAPYEYNITDNSICEGEALFLNAPVVAGYDTYIWTRPDQTKLANNQLEAGMPGKYVIVALNSVTGCSAKDSIDVQLKSPLTPPTGNNIAACVGSGIPPFTVTGIAGATFRWFESFQDYQNGTSIPGANGATYIPSVNTTVPQTFQYLVTQNAPNSCESDPLILTLTIASTPTVELGANRNVCAGALETLDATNPGASYAWNTGQTTATIKPAISGTYKVKVTVGTCVVEDEVTLTVVQGPKLNMRQKEYGLCIRDGEFGVTLDAGTGRNFVYEWTRPGLPGVLATTQTYTTSNLGKYIITVNDGSGCIARDTVEVFNRCEPKIFIPNAFTPNGDGLNDNLDVEAKYITDFEMKIFNRWGELIYMTNSIDKPWNGKYLGKVVPPGTYVYSASYKSLDYPGRPAQQLKGGILVIN